MNSLEIISDIRHQLTVQIGQRASLPALQPLAISPWLAMALLQKSIRRGRDDLALRAAATLLMDAPDRLWRRIGGIAFEDIGVGDLNTVAVATSALGGKRFRAAIGGEWAVASFLINEMARARKCRAADDLLMSCELHPTFDTARREFPGLATRDLIAIATGRGSIHERALALWFALGTDRRTSRHLPARRGEPQAVFDALCAGGLPHTVVEIAREGFKKTGEMLAPFVALLASVDRGDDKIVTDEMPPETMIGNVPSWSMDIYTREGRAAFAEFLRTDSASARWIGEHVRPARRIDFLGHMLFRVEGGLALNRMRWALADELRRLVDLGCIGVEVQQATEFLELLKGDIGILNGVRAELNGGSNHG
jgi:hypothetical protein